MPQPSLERVQVTLAALLLPEVHRDRGACSPLKGSRCLDVFINKPKHSILSLVKLNSQWHFKGRVRQTPSPTASSTVSTVCAYRWP